VSLRRSAGGADGACWIALRVFTLQIATRSLVGARDRNEDDLRTGQRDGIAYAVLSDGAGGHKNGAVASDLVVRAVMMGLQSQSELQPHILHDMVHDTHDLLLQQQREAADRERMHATLVALWIDAARGQALWSHVGDSRLYLLRNGVVQHVTRDDSVVRQMVDAGLITAEAARMHPRKNQLVCAMGVEAGFVAHTIEKAYALADGDAFLMCTDGWWEHLDRADIERTFTEARDAKEWLALMETRIQAEARPDQDNHSAVAVRVGA
jgi:serine/threonine protein phosphatase PrpC